MVISYNKHIFLSIAIKLLLFCCSSASVSLSAQSDEDSVSVINELALDHIEENTEPKDDTKKPKQENFIRKKERYTVWQPSLQRNIPDSVIDALKKEDAFWYADFAEETKLNQSEKNRATPLVMQSWFRTLVWMLILTGFIFFLITYLAGSNVGLFRKKNTIITESEDEQMPEDIFAINYQKEIDKAASAGNYRLAVRLLFLQGLKNMSEKNIINYKQDKTNFDYLSELHGTSLHKQFFKVTRNYEYTWYGQFEISKDTFLIILNDFTHFENQLG